MRPTKAKEPPRQIVELPLLPNPDGKLAVAVTLNGNVPANFLLDTDWLCDAITETLAVKLKAEPAPDYRSRAATVNGYAGLWVTRLPSLEFGPIKISNPLSLVGPDKFIQLAGDELKLDGIISPSSLRRWRLAVAVYPHAAKLKLFVPGGLPARERTAAGFGPEASEVPLKWEDNELNYTCQATLTRGEKSWTGPLILDTGSNLTTISADAAKQLGLVAVGSGHASSSGPGASILAAHVDQLRVGGLTRGPIEQMCYPVPDDRWIEVLGMDVLKHYNLLIDFVSDKMYLTPLDDTGSPTGEREQR